MTANWAFAPVCGLDFWRVIVTSPEVMIFLFFMITDPKTVPAGRVGRVVFGVLVGDHEHAPPGAPDRRVRDEGRAARGARRAVRGPADPRPPRCRRRTRPPTTCAGSRRRIVDRRAGGRRRRPGGGRASVSPPLAVLGLGVAIVAAGTPARGTVVADSTEILNRLPAAIDPSTLPPITVGQDVIDFDHQLGGAGIQAGRS